MRTLIALLALLLAPAAAGETPRAQLLREAASTVLINTEDYRGSGVVVARHDGATFVITCLHVVHDQQKIELSGFFSAGEGHRARASVEVADEDADLALLYTTDLAFELPASPVARRSPRQLDRLDVLGLPNGSPSVSSGVVTTMRLLKFGITGAVIEHGASGGPAFNEGGEVVGVVSQVEVTHNDEDIFNMGYCVSRFAIERLAGPYLVPPRR